MGMSIIITRVIMLIMRTTGTSSHPRRLEDRLGGECRDIKKGDRNTPVRKCRMKTKTESRIVSKASTMLFIYM